MSNFVSLDGFRESLYEVDILCDAAMAALSEPRKFSVFNKAALLLIAGKFESFAESIVAEYVFKLNELALPCHLIPDAIRFQHTFYALRALEKGRLPTQSDEARLIFCELGKLWNSTDNFVSLKVETSFSYGKHGEKELVKLFERIGINDIFQTILLTERVETIAAENPIEKQIEFRGIFNSASYIRNNILHEDDTPSLSTAQVKEYRRHFESFAIKLDSHLWDLLQLAKDLV